MADKKKPSDTSNKDAVDASSEADSSRVAENSVDDAFFDGDKSMEDLRDEDAAASPIDAEDAAELEKVMKPGSNRSRHPIMAGMVILASLALLWLMEEDIRYFFQRGEPTKLGKAAEAVKEGRLKDNRYVEIQTTPDINTWATVSRRGCSLGGKTSPKSYYTFYTVRDTDDKLIVRRAMNWKERTEQQKRKTIQLTVSGRLRLFSKQGEYYTKYRRFLAKIAKKNPALQNRHEVTASKLRKHIGKSKAVLKDTEGGKVRMEPQTEFALYASFDDELEMSVMRGHKVKADKVTFKGQDGPPRCGPMVPKRGARVVLFKDSKTLDFGKLKEGLTVTPTGVSSKGSHPTPSKKAAGSQDEGSKPKDRTKDRTKDLWLKVPLSTKAFDAKTGDPIPFKKSQLLVADGGECGGKKGQTRTINLEALPLNSRKHAELYVSRFDLPYKLIDENGIAFEFILKAPKKKGQKLLREQRRGDPFTIDFRTEWYLCHWNEVKLQEDHLIISPVRPNHPVGYKVVKRKPREPGARSASEAPSRPRARSQTRAAVLKNAAKVARGGKKNPAEGDKKTENKTNKTTDKATETLSSGKASPKTPSSGASKLTLVKKRPKGHIRLPFDGVRKARITTRRKLPARSYLLLTGEDPDAYWYYPAIALLLIGFIGFNLWSIRNYFKYIRPAEKRAQMGD